MYLEVDNRSNHNILIDAKIAKRSDCNVKENQGK